MIIYDVFAKEFINEEDKETIAPPERYIYPKTTESLLYFTARYLAQHIKE